MNNITITDENGTAVAAVTLDELAAIINALPYTGGTTEPETAPVDAELPAKEQPNGVKTCEWTQDEPGSDYYDTDCGQAFQFIDGTPAENSFNFCPFCGQRIQEIAQLKENS